MNDSWYDVVASETRLTQGDLIFDCPVLQWQSTPIREKEDSKEQLKSAIDAVVADVIVMTQACDLEQEKIQNVILCPHYPLSEYKDIWTKAKQEINQNITAKAWKRECEDIRNGFVWNLAILNSTMGELSIEHRIVDFHEVFSIPLVFIESLIRQRQVPRLRLRSPYREHLSQAFARFFMRVGLPVGVSLNW